MENYEINQNNMYTLPDYYKSFPVTENQKILSPQSSDYLQIGTTYYNTQIPHNETKSDLRQFSTPHPDINDSVRQYPLERHDFDNNVTQYPSEHNVRQYPIERHNLKII